MKFEYTDMDAYEFLKNLVENSNLITVIQYFHDINKIKSAYETHMRNKRTMEAMKNSEDSFLGKIVEAFSGYQDWDKRTEEENAETYEKVIKDWKNLSQEPDIIYGIQEKLLDLYDEMLKEIERVEEERQEAKESGASEEQIAEIQMDSYLKSELTITVAALLRLEQAKIPYKEVETWGWDDDPVDKDNPWQDVEDVISQILMQMETDDFIMTVEMAGISGLFRNSVYREVLKEKIKSSDKYQFIRLSADTWDGMDGFKEEEQSIKQEKFARMWKSGLSPFVFRLAYSTLGEVQNSEEILDNIEDFDVVGMLCDRNLFRNESIEEQMKSLYDRLTPTQVVQYLIKTRGYFAGANQEQTEIVKNKINQLSDDDIRFLSFLFLQSGGIIREGENGKIKTEYRNHELKPENCYRDYILKIAIERGIVFSEIRREKKHRIDEEMVNNSYIYIETTEDEEQEFRKREKVYSDADVGYNIPNVHASIGEILNRENFSIESELPYDKLLKIYRQNKGVISSNRSFLQTMEYYSKYPVYIIMLQLVEFSKQDFQPVDATSPRFSLEEQNAMQYKRYFTHYYNNRLLSFPADILERLKPMLKGTIFEDTVEEALRVGRTVGENGGKKDTKGSIGEDDGNR